MDTHDMSPLETALELIGGTVAAARKLGVKPAAISQMRKRGQAPSNRCVRIEELTNGRVTRYQLRPDVFGQAPPGKAKQ
jgi:DNA-binding transcriptional regulator YdaS (Cro superfamily)